MKIQNSHVTKKAELSLFYVLSESGNTEVIDEGYSLSCIEHII